MNEGLCDHWNTALDNQALILNRCCVTYWIKKSLTSPQPGVNSRQVLNHSQALNHDQTVVYTLYVYCISFTIVCLNQVSKCDSHFEWLKIQTLWWQVETLTLEFCVSQSWPCESIFLIKFICDIANKLLKRTKWHVVNEVEQYWMEYHRCNCIADKLVLKRCSLPFFIRHESVFSSNCWLLGWIGP